MLCQKCNVEMKKKEPWKKSYPMVYLCKSCNAFTIEYQNGRLEWHNEKGELFSHKIIKNRGNQFREQ